MKKMLLSVLAIFIGGIIMLAPVSAVGNCPDGCTPTSILGENGCSCDDGKGSSIMDVLKLVVDIMSVGVGVLGAIGIGISGVQYLTAAGNEEKTRKARHRILEIVIGLAVYVAIYVVLRWLLPDFNGLN